jgi:hypothetical protein
MALANGTVASAASSSFGIATPRCFSRIGEKKIGAFRIEKARTRNQDFAVLHESSTFSSTLCDDNAIFSPDCSSFRLIFFLFTSTFAMKMATALLRFDWFLFPPSQLYV